MKEKMLCFRETEKGKCTQVAELTAQINTKLLKDTSSETLLIRRNKNMPIIFPEKIIKLIEETQQLLQSEMEEEKYKIHRRLVVLERALGVRPEWNKEDFASLHLHDVKRVTAKREITRLKNQLKKSSLEKEKIKLSNTTPFLHGYTHFKPIKGGALLLICPICKRPITEFFIVPEEEWNTVTKEYKEYVICKKCYNKLKKESGKSPEKD